MDSSSEETPEIGVRRRYSRGFAERGCGGVIQWEVLPVVDGEELTLHFESVGSPWRQGVWLRTDLGLSVSGIQAPSVTLWQDTAPAIVPFTCRTANGFLSFYNVWDSGRHGGRESLSYSSGMLVEEFAGGCRYSCNDIGFATEFRKLIFSIHRTATPST